MRTRARFEKEAKGTSDMAYLLTLSRLKDFSVKTANLTNDTEPAYGIRVLYAKPQSIVL